MDRRTFINTTAGVTGAAIWRARKFSAHNDVENEHYDCAYLYERKN